jgi:flagellar biosynthesis protein FlhG
LLVFRLLQAGGFPQSFSKRSFVALDPKGQVSAPGIGVTAGHEISAASPAVLPGEGSSGAIKTVVAPLPAKVHSAPRARRRIVAVGGGKGGIGKSLITSSLGISLARRGQSVVVIDADLGGANLHTALGVSTPKGTLSDFIHHRVESIEDVIVETGIPNLGLISGAYDFLTASNLKYFQKTRILNRIRKIDADFILLDIGAGISLNIVDFFLLAELGLLVVVPEPSSIEGAYRFLKMSFYRHLWSGLKGTSARSVIENAMDQKNQYGIRTPFDLLETVEQMDPKAGASLKQKAMTFRPRLLVNQTRFPEDERLGLSMAAVCRKHLGVDIDCVGTVPYDDGVWRAHRKRTPFVVVSPDSPTARSIDQAAGRLLSSP